MLISIAGIYSYFGAAKYDVVTLQGTLRNSGENLIGGRSDSMNFDFYIEEKRLRFRVDNISYKCFQRDLFKSFALPGSRVTFDADRNLLEKPKKPADAVETVYVYSLKDDKYDYLTLEDSKKCNAQNRKAGLYLGIGFFVGALLLFGIRTTLPE